MPPAPPLPSERRPDIAGLKAFARRTDRDDPLHFVGRGNEIGRLARTLNDTAEAFFSGAGGQKGNTRLITAAPGAGKTALLEEIAGRWEREGRARIARLKTSDLREPRAAIRKIALQLDPEAGQRLGVATEKSGELGFSKVIHAIRATSKRWENPWPRSMGELAQWLAERWTEMGVEGPPPPLVLMVDEIQNVAMANRDSAPLCETHEGIREYPVMLVLAGLSDSESALAAAGISRLDRNSRVLLGGLNEGEPADAARQLFDHFGARGSEAEREAWAKAIEADSCGWPQHLACGLAGAAEALAAAEGDLAQASLDGARATAARHRGEYYGRQIAPFEGMTPLLEAVAAALPEEKNARVPKDVINGAVREAYKAHPHLTGEMRRAEVFPTLLRKGLVQKHAAGQYACPIPSFKTYVEEFCAAARLEGQAAEPEPPGLEAQP